ncbi:MAG: hypothetical protein IT301_13330 [Dehalococcoidia bacterium]|nr:hypothetical protein [Dehalococcoidia bacterium]
MSAASGMALRLLLALRGGIFGHVRYPIRVRVREISAWFDRGFDSDDWGLDGANRKVVAALNRLEEGGLVERCEPRSRLELRLPRVADNGGLLPLNLVRKGWLSGPEGWLVPGSDASPYLSGAELLLFIHCLAIANSRSLVLPARGVRRPAISRYFRLDEVVTGLSKPTQRAALERLLEKQLVHVRKSAGRWICVLDPDLDVRPTKNRRKRPAVE